MENPSYAKLKVWEKADALAFKIYLTTKAFTRDEVFGMTSQLRRAALSIPTNIVAGYGRQNKNEFKRFLKIALGSLFEIEYLLNFSFRLNYINSVTYIYLQDLRREVGALLWSLYKKI